MSSQELNSKDTTQDNDNSENDNINTIVTYESFDAMELKEELLRGIYSHGFNKPSAIQAKAIKPIIMGRDIMAQAQSGTGKTGTFVVSILQLINTDLNEPQAMIIGPTRELAEQIKKVCGGIGAYTNVRICSCIGGIHVSSNIDSLSQGMHIVVGTPGRIYHMIKDRHLKLNQMKLLILDEADEMLREGFKAQMYEIFNMGFPQTMQVALFSATLTDQTNEIAMKFLRNPQKIVLEKKEVNLAGIKQYQILLEKQEYKLDTLIDILKSVSLCQSIIFVNSKQTLISLAKDLQDLKISITCIYGDMEQVDRNKTMDEFRSGTFRHMLSTDVTARGIDIQQVQLVINYDIPLDRQNYMHRIGRTGRYGRRGVAINFVTKRDEPLVDDIKGYYHLSIDDLPSDLTGIFDK